mmetsp:Transcript_94319/g.131045  ORF Transcript_94319/g.131045 Transcript_94319/m.131045 type:complete len:232 (+) Transcript_94319:321-1016(+)
MLVDQIGIAAVFLLALHRSLLIPAFDALEDPLVHVAIEPLLQRLVPRILPSHEVHLRIEDSTIGSSPEELFRNIFVDLLLQHVRQVRHMCIDMCCKLRQPILQEGLNTLLDRQRLVTFAVVHDEALVGIQGLRSMTSAGYAASDGVKSCGRGARDSCVRRVPSLSTHATFAPVSPHLSLPLLLGDLRLLDRNDFLDPCTNVSPCSRAADLVDQARPFLLELKRIPSLGSRN